MKADLIVVGGGPAGSSLALFMVRHGWSVLQVDAGSHADFKPGEGMIPATRRLLNELGIWDRFLEQRHLPSYGNDSLWGSAGVQSTAFIQSVDGHGWRLDRVVFDGLLREMGREAGVQFRRGFVERVEGEAGDWKLLLRSGERIGGKWVVDATGRSARLARQLGSRRQESDRLVAFWRQFEPGEAGDRYSASLTESRPEGWWYNALLPSGRRVVYCFTDADLPVVRELQEEAGFLELLGKTSFVRERLDRFGYRAVGAGGSADSRTARLDRIFGDHWLAVGDAALSFDPLSSQGIMTALYGGVKAGEALLGGRTGDLESYAEAMGRVWEVYLGHRSRAYQMELRWREAPFWERR